MSDNRPIGVYDSGIGGLTVFKKLSALLPEENFIEEEYAWAVPF